MSYFYGIQDNTGTYGSDFLIGKTVDDKYASLAMRLGSKEIITYQGALINMAPGGKAYSKQVLISRSQTGYEFKPMQLTLKSACEFA